jgi:hypothetical protein
MRSTRVSTSVEVCPSRAFDSLFENCGSLRHLSVLDRVKDRAERLSRTLSAADTDTLDAYLTTVVPDEQIPAAPVENEMARAAAHRGTLIDERDRTVRRIDREGADRTRRVPSNWLTSLTANNSRRFRSSSRNEGFDVAAANPSGTSVVFCGTSTFSVCSLNR